MKSKTKDSVSGCSLRYKLTWDPNQCIHPPTAPHQMKAHLDSLCSNLILEEFLVFMVFCFNHLLKLANYQYQFQTPVEKVLFLYYPQVLLKKEIQPEKKNGLRVTKDRQSLLLKRRKRNKPEQHVPQTILLNSMFLRLSY